MNELSKVIQITNNKGLKFNVRLITEFKNTPLRTFKEPYVEFYDVRYNFTEYGQFINRYYLSSLNESLPAWEGGLNLYGGEPDWSLDRNTFNDAMAAINAIYQFVLWQEAKK